MKVDAADLVNGMHPPAERHWRRLDGPERLAQVTEVRYVFKNGSQLVPIKTVYSPSGCERMK